MDILKQVTMKQREFLRRNARLPDRLIMDGSHYDELRKQIAAMSRRPEELPATVDECMGMLVVKTDATIPDGIKVR